MKIQILCLFACFGLIFLSQPNPTSGLPTPTGDQLTFAEISVKDLLKKGVAIPKEVISNVGNFFANLESKVNFAREEIEQLERFCEENEVRNFDLTSSYWNEYYPIRTDLRQTREQLRSLARKTVKFGEEMEVYFNSALANDRKLKLAMNKLKVFLKSSGEILEAANIQYQSALAKLEAFLPNFKNFEIEMTKLTSYDDATYKKWEAEIRGSVYGGTAAGTVACGLAGLADIALLGVCSAIYNSVAWPAAVASVEITIAAYKAQFEAAQSLGVRLVRSFKELEGQLDQSIKFLEQEIDIINEWEEVVDNAENNIDSIPLDEVPTLSQIFIGDIADLKRVAKKFLDRPFAIFER